MRVPPYRQWPWWAKYVLGIVVCAVVAGIVLLPTALSNVHSRPAGPPTPTASPVAGAVPSQLGPVTTFQPSNAPLLSVVAPNDTGQVADIKAEYNAGVVGSRFFSCPDGRNRGLGYGQLPQITPCVNGALDLIIDHGQLQLTDSTGAATPATNGTIDTHGWHITSYSYQGQPVTHDDGTTTAPAPYVMLGYTYSSNVTPFWAYVRQLDGVNAWGISINLDDVTFSANAKYEVVLTWHDAAIDTDADAPVPFSWRGVPKDPYLAGIGITG